MQRNSVIRRSRRYLAILSVVLIVTGGLLAWQGYVAYRDFERYQDEATRQAVQGSADQVAQLLIDLRGKVDMLTYSYRDEIAAVISDPENHIHNEILGKHVAHFFPGHFTTALSDASGASFYFCLTD